MELSLLVKDMLKDMTYEEFLRQQERASLAKKFRFFKHSFVDKCSICNKVTDRYGYVSTNKYYGIICSSCARKVARAILLSTSLKHISEREYSKGVGFGYKLATETSFGKESYMFIDMVVDDAKKEGKQVHFLGRDMDLFYVCFNLEDNVNYLPGWNRSFKYDGSAEAKRKLLARYEVEQGDYVIDTGFAGSIIDNIRMYQDVRGFLLSAEDYAPYTSLYKYGEGSKAYDYREWICKVEHMDRAREVRCNPETQLYDEFYSTPSRYENGVFHGFVRGINKVMNA